MFPITAQDALLPNDQFASPQPTVSDGPPPYYPHAHTCPGVLFPPGNEALDADGVATLYATQVPHYAPPRGLSNEEPITSNSPGSYVNPHTSGNHLPGSPPPRQRPAEGTPNP